MNTKVIILAGGRGSRFGAVKQFVPFHNKPLFIYTLKALSNFDKVLVVPKKYIKEVKKYIKKYKINNIEIVIGGNTRQESVFNALNYLDTKGFTGYIAITDANRPFIKEATIKKCFKLLNSYDSVVTVCKSINTSCLVWNKKVTEIYERADTYSLLMPQCFNFKTLYNAHLMTYLENTTDDTQILMNINPNSLIKTVPVSFWEGIKLTYKEDYDVFTFLLGRKI